MIFFGEEGTYREWPWLVVEQRSRAWSGELREHAAGCVSM